MASVKRETQARSRLFFHKAEPTAKPAKKPKFAWCCFCPSDAPAKGAKALDLPPRPKAPKTALVSSGEAGRAPAVQPVPYVPVAEMATLEEQEPVYDFSHYHHG